ncbi:MAG TPA: hypothetical protein VKT74_07420 [Gammaproteobacteria bacterium]|nr:hypothetical protein [Gammaproteobacteria bacterium]
MDTRKLNGIALAALAATLFATAPLAADQPGSTPGKCFGVNTCKGKSSCQSAGHSCKGQNSCKGKGFVIISKDACEQIGGKFEPGA